MGVLFPNHFVNIRAAADVRRKNTRSFPVWPCKERTAGKFLVYVRERDKTGRGGAPPLTVAPHSNPIKARLHRPAKWEGRRHRRAGQVAERLES